jgi:hypothetical protein
VPDRSPYRPVRTQRRCQEEGPCPDDQRSIPHVLSGPTHRERPPGAKVKPLGPQRPDTDGQQAECLRCHCGPLPALSLGLGRAVGLGQPEGGLQERRLGGGWGSGGGEGPLGREREGLEHEQRVDCAGEHPGRAGEAGQLCQVQRGVPLCAQGQEGERRGEEGGAHAREVLCQGGKGRTRGRARERA